MDFSMVFLKSRSIVFSCLWASDGTFWEYNEHPQQYVASSSNWRRQVLFQHPTLPQRYYPQAGTASQKSPQLGPVSHTTRHNVTNAIQFEVKFIDLCLFFRHAPIGDDNYLLLTTRASLLPDRQIWGSEHISHCLSPTSCHFLYIHPSKH